MTPLLNPWAVPGTIPSGHWHFELGQGSDYPFHVEHFRGIATSVDVDWCLLGPYLTPRVDGP
jgi:hypothetical protein